MKRRRFATVSFFFFGSVVARRAKELGRVPENRNADWRGTNNASLRSRAHRKRCEKLGIDRSTRLGGGRNGAVAATRIERVTMCPDAERSRGRRTSICICAAKRCASAFCADCAPANTVRYCSTLAMAPARAPRRRCATPRPNRRARVSTPLLGRPALASRRSAVTPPAARVQNSARWRGRRLCFTLTRKLFNCRAPTPGTPQSALRPRGRAKSQLGGKFATGRQEFGGKTVYGSFKPCFLSRGPGKSGRSLFIKVRTSSLAKIWTNDREPALLRARA